MMANKLDMTADFLVARGLLTSLTGGTPLAKRIGRKLFTQYARRVRDDFRANAPEGETRKLRKSIKARSTRSGGAQVYGDRRVAPHIHFRDAGTKQRKTKAGANRGSVEATHWITKAQQRARERFQAEVAKPLLDEVVKTLKGGIGRV